MQQALLYFNPVAGRQAISEQRLRKVLQLLFAHGIHCQAVASKPRAEGPPRLPLEGKQLLIAMGGDGTIHELLPLAVRHRIPLGILPSGTANVLAEELAIPLQIERAVRVLSDGYRRKMSLGRADGEYFHLMAGIGIDALVIGYTSSRLKKRLGKTAYWLAGLKTFFKMRLEPFELTAEGTAHRASFAVISNCHYYGGKLQVTPHANPFSGRLEVCLFEGTHRSNYIRYVLGILTGRHLGFRDVKAFSTHRIEVTIPGLAPVQLDGDVTDPTPSIFEIESDVLDIIVPRGDGERPE